MGCDFFLDHLHRDGCRHGLLPHGGIRRQDALEDVDACRFPRHFGCRRALLLHARVLGADRPFSDRLPLHRLDHHRPVANGRVLLDLVGGAAHHRWWHVLASVDRDRLHAAFGYLGESKIMSPMIGFALGMCGWAFILFEIFAGEASKVANELGKASKYVTSSFSTMRIIVSVGWAIYPLGYFLGMTGNGNESILNLVYNLADFVNKIAFCLAIWHAAKEETLETGSDHTQALLA